MTALQAKPAVGMVRAVLLGLEPISNTHSLRSTKLPAAAVNDDFCDCQDCPLLRHLTAAVLGLRMAATSLELQPVLAGQVQMKGSCTCALN